MIPTIKIKLDYPIEGDSIVPDQKTTVDVIEIKGKATMMDLINIGYDPVNPMNQLVKILKIMSVRPLTTNQILSIDARDVQRIADKTNKVLGGK